MAAWINENTLLAGGIALLIIIGIILMIVQRRKHKNNKEADIEKVMREEAVKARAGKPKAETPIAEAMAELLEVWPSLEDGQQEMAAAVWLRQERGPQIIDRLGEDPNAETALAALWPWLQNDDLRRRLVETLRHETPRAAAATAALMPRIENSLMVPLLLTALLNSQKYLTARAGEALAACGRPGIRAMEALFAKSSGKIKETLLQVLAQIPAENGSSDLLAEALKDKAPEVRCAAIAAIGAWQLPEGVALLKPLCKDQEITVRAAVAAALGEFGGEESKAALESIDTGGEWAVEAAVKAALCRFQPEEVLAEGENSDMEAASENTSEEAAR